MLGVYASAAVILLASLVLGRALLHIVGLSVHTWLGGVAGFAVLTIACPLLIRLPGRGITVAVLLGLEALGVFLLPAGVALFLFELGLVATLQAFIFATLSAIYLGGAVAEHH